MTPPDWTAAVFTVDPFDARRQPLPPPRPLPRQVLLASLECDADTHLRMSLSMHAIQAQRRPIPWVQDELGYGPLGTWNYLTEVAA